jgi:hypothetical protein
LRKPAFKFWILLLVFPLCVTAPAAQAAVKVLPSKPLITALSPVGSGDQISDFALNPSLVAIVGTVESGLTDLVTSATLGGSDGFISALDKNKKLIWNLRLGGQSDDIATSITKDKDGNFWVLGATSKPLETTTAVIDSTVINLDSITVDAVTTPTNTLNRLALWKVDVTGQLSQSYFYDVDGVIAPTAITMSGSTFKITANLSKELMTQQFTISADSAGIFSELKLGKVPTPKPQAIETIKAGTNKITSFVSKTTIVDIPSWRAKVPTPVIVKYTKAGKALYANSLPGKVIKVLWQSGIGVVVLVEANSDNQIHLLAEMA